MWLRAPGPWSSGPLFLWFFSPLVLVLWSRGPLVAWSSPLVFGCGFWKVNKIASYRFWSFEKTGPLQSTICVAFDMLRLLRSQETANTVFAVLERLRML